jgi:hypothetical protein
MTDVATEPPRRGPHRRAPSIWSTAVLAALLAAVLTVVAWFRLDGTTRGTGWADDSVFLGDAVDHGLWPTLFEPYGLPFLVLGVALAVVTTVRLVRRRRGARRDVVVVVFCLVGTVAPFTAGFVLNHVAQPGTVTLAGLADERPLRYGLVSSMFLLATAIVAADRLPRLLPWRRVLAPALALAVAGLCVANLDVGRTYRSEGPAWVSGLAPAQDARRHHAAYGAVFFAPHEQLWMVKLPCEKVLDG